MLRPDSETMTGAWRNAVTRCGLEEAVESSDPLLARIGRIVDPGRQPGGFFTFRAAPGADKALAWEAWLEGVFRPVILPHFLAVMELAQRSHGREVAQMDRELDAALPADARVPSRLAGTRLLKGLAEAQGLRMVKKWVLRVNEGAMPAHLATLFAAQCAIFSFPTRQSVLAYLHLEWQAAAMKRATPEETRLFQRSLERAATLVDQLLAARHGLAIVDKSPVRQVVSLG